MNGSVVFDLDGTLVHSAPDLHAAANRMLRSFERPQLSLKIIISFIGNGVPKLVERCLLATGDARSLPEAIDLFHDLYSANLSTLTRPYPGVIDTLEALQAAGRRMGICTNKPEQAARQLCDDLDLSKYFTTILGGNSLAVRKPNPAPLHEAMARLGAGPDNCLYVGDSVIDFRTAEAARLPFAFFEGGYQPVPIKGVGRHRSFDDWANFLPLIPDVFQSGPTARS